METTQQNMTSAQYFINTLLHSTSHKDRTAAVQMASLHTLIASKVILSRLTTSYNGSIALARIESELLRRERNNSNLGVRVS